MSVVMDTPLTVRGFRVAALARVELQAQVDRKATVGWGAKTPLAILIGGPGGVMAFDPAGRALDRAQVEAMLPGVWDRLASAPD